MTFKRFSAISVAVAIVITTGCSPSSSSTESFDEPLSAGTFSSVSVESFAEEPPPPDMSNEKPLYTTENGNVWLINTSFFDSNRARRDYPIYITLPENLSVSVGQTTQIYDGDVKLADVYRCDMLNGQSLSDLFENRRTEEFVVAILDEGGYEQNDGREAYYMIAETNYEAKTRYVYDYCLEVSSGIAIEVIFYADEYDPDQMRPLCESIVGSIQPYET